METQKKRCVLIAGGELGDSMASQLRPDDVIWAIDAGTVSAKRLGFTPSLCLGDWDSAPCPETDAERITLPPEKDDTDTYYAAKLAAARGFTELLLLGGLGGRLDHTLANISTLLFLRRAGVRATLMDETTELSVLCGESRSFTRREGFYFSVFPLDGAAAGVTLRGTKYPLTDATLCADYPIGVSNEITDDFATVSVKNGNLLVMYARK